MRSTTVGKPESSTSTLGSNSWSLSVSLSSSSDRPSLAATMRSALTICSG